MPHPIGGRVIQSNFERAATTVLDRHPRVRADLLDPVVEEIQAADGEVEERAAFVSLDVRREHTCRRLSRARANRARVDDAHASPTPRELAPHRTADDPRPDDQNVRVRHEAIIRRSACTVHRSTCSARCKVQRAGCNVPVQGAWTVPRQGGDEHRFLHLNAHVALMHIAPGTSHSCHRTLHLCTHAPGTSTLHRTMHVAPCTVHARTVYGAR
jgi:hypothetical protein